jgi:hypothetical protein
VAWNTAILARPIPPLPFAATMDPAEDPVPDLQPEPPAFPLHLIAARGVPARPHVNTPASTNGAGNDTEKLGSPVIAPSLSPQETSAAQQQTNESLAIAEKNLAAARGKNLNETQLDLVSKIQSFIKDARDAMRLADWARARGFAKKAQVLSEELADSL